MAVAGGASIGSGPTPLLRKGVPGEKKPLREKLLMYYELLFEVILCMKYVRWILSEGCTGVDCVKPVVT